MKYETIVVSGYWLDDNAPFEDKLVALGDWDEIEDYDDEQIFFYLDGAEPLGIHGEFCITSFSPNTVSEA